MTTMIETTPEEELHRAIGAIRGDLEQCRKAYDDLRQDLFEGWSEHDLALVDAASGNVLGALDRLDTLVEECESEPQQRVLAAIENRNTILDEFDPTGDERPLRVAILSLLFNWPSTGGGTVHTFELARFLSEAGYDVRHLFARYAPWQLGEVAERLPYQHRALEFGETDWTAETICTRFRDALRLFAPDVVIVTDSWNTKPLLCAAASDWPYLIRLAAQECLCPLNNVRLLPSEDGVRQCSHNQLKTAALCRACVATHASGPLHQLERELAGVDEPGYEDLLQTAFASAAGVLAVNPEIAGEVAGACRRIEVLPSGFDPERFVFAGQAVAAGDAPQRVLFAGLTGEAMKGFHVLRAACRLLRNERQDFELVITASELTGGAEPYEQLVGWQSQAELPQLMRSAAVVVVPTVAQEALGRTAVEAFGCGVPVVASRIGGLAWVVDHEENGLLVEPGNPHELAEALGRLLDDAELRTRMGAAGRAKFEREFLWEGLIADRYAPLFAEIVQTARGGSR